MTDRRDPRQDDGRPEGLPSPLKRESTSSAPAPEAVAAPSALALPADPPQPLPDLKTWQRDVMDARLAVLQFVKALERKMGVEVAIRRVVAMAAGGELPPEVQAMVVKANARRGKKGGRTLCRSTLYQWRQEVSRGTTALAPKSVDRLDVPVWVGLFLKLYQRPQKPSLKGALDLLAGELPAGIPCPSYDQVRRWLSKSMSHLELMRGRMGPRDLRSLRAFVRRDFSGLWPNDVATADGHTFDAEVAHPVHGRPFRPEITTVLDVATRKATGWSAGLAESTWAVLDAIRNTVESCGIPAVFYVDKGSGHENALMNDLATGFMARLGITKKNSIPYNSQARGVIERFHQTVWVGASKALPTFVGAGMDKEAKQKIFKVTRAHIKAAGSSPLLLPWDEFLVRCQILIDAYNDRPHRALPKVRDPETGRLRHLSPNERWAQLVGEGFKPDLLSKEESLDLFRPYREAKVSRGEIRINSNIYFHKALEHHHGGTVQVGYDIHDASQVWVRSVDGILLCVAHLDGNKRPYFPKSVIEQAREIRAKGRLKRLEAKAQEVREELLGPAEVVEAEVSEDLTPEQLEATDAAFKAIEEANAPAPALPPSEDGRPHFADDREWALWVMENPEQATDGDRQELERRLRSTSFRNWIGLEDDGGFRTAPDRRVSVP